MSNSPPIAAERKQFESKWTQLRPELGLALRFVAPAQQPFHAAMQCLALELDYAAYRIREDSVATAKLQWWGQELAAAADGRALHPLTEVLAAHPHAADAFSHAPTLIAAAIAQRERDPAGSLDAQLAQLQPFMHAISLIESKLLASDADASAQVRMLDRLVRDLAALPELVTQDELPLSLDLLARHGLTRADLNEDSPARNAALTDALAGISERLKRVDAGGLSPATAAVLHAQRRRVRRAAAAADPLAALDAGLMLLTPLDALRCWRHARRRTG